jgi:hypothetical protein
MPDWVSPRWEWYYRLWHDLLGLDYPVTYYLEQWPWTMIIGLLSTVGVVVLWRYSHSKGKQWLADLGIGVWCFFMGHLYFPTMN